MAQPLTPLVLPVTVYRVGHTCFSEAQVRAMIARTNRKLTANGAGIQIEEEPPYYHLDHDPLLAYVTQDEYDQNVKHLLEYDPGTVRVFLVKFCFEAGYGAFAFATDDDPYSGAIFVTECYNDDSDEAYHAMGYVRSNDTLLHELGHVLMCADEHYKGPRLNFFHDKAERTDDSMLPEQIERMRNSPFLEQESRVAGPQSRTAHNDDPAGDE